MHTPALHLLALSTIEGADYWSLRKLYERGQGLEYLWERPVDEVARHIMAAAVPQAAATARLLTARRRSLFAAAQARAEALARRGVTVLCSDEPAFPDLLRDIPYPPYWLFVHGSPNALLQPSIACVGTRRPTDEGKQMAKWATEAVIEDRLTVVSGLARGIDALAHGEAVRRHSTTVAVLGQGIDVPLPPAGGRLRDRIVAHGGAIVSEYLPGEPTSARHLVWRDRLQSGLALCTVPVEWHPQSGTAHTVRFACAQGRRVVGLIHEDWRLASHPEFQLLMERRVPILEAPRDLGKLAHTCRNGPLPLAGDAETPDPESLQLPLFPNDP